MKLSPCWFVVLPIALQAQTYNPFGSVSSRADGLAGKIYALPENTRQLPDFNQLRPLGTIYTPEINISQRSWTDGFPGVTNRFEWFGIVYEGVITAKKRGIYTFRVVSDDGTKLFVDDKLIIDNDGIHPPGERSGQVALDGAEHRIRLHYFQGPKDYIALQLFVKYQNAEETIFPGNVLLVTPIARPLQGEQVVWHGRILDDSTHQPLPQARLLPATPEAAVVVEAAVFDWRALPGRTYAYEVQHPGYYVAHGSWASVAERKQDILLRKIRVGSTVRLENVQFKQGKAILLPGAETALQKLLTLLAEHPTMTIELAGHTDNVGDADKNLQLSQDRVAAVKAYLVRRGTAAARIRGRGYGGTRPRASNDREETRRLNRRVEFTITSIE